MSTQKATVFPNTNYKENLILKKATIYNSNRKNETIRTWGKHNKRWISSS